MTSRRASRLYHATAAGYAVSFAIALLVAAGSIADCGAIILESWSRSAAGPSC